MADRHHLREPDPSSRRDEALDEPEATRIAPGTFLGSLAQRMSAGQFQQLIQRRRASHPRSAPDAASAAAADRPAGTGGPLPHMAAIQKSFGAHDVSGIRAHTDGAAKASAEAIDAEAFAIGENVAFAGAPSLHTAAHEAAHVVQQRGGVSLPGGMGKDGDAYERHADAVADRVVRGQPAHSLLGEPGGRAPASTFAVQRKPKSVEHEGDGGTDEKHADEKKPTNTISIGTRDAAIVVGGHKVDDVDAAVPRDDGPTRYVRTNGVGDCIAYAFHGERKTDGRPATMMAHLSSGDYTIGEKGIDLSFVSQFKSKVNLKGAVAVTNFDSQRNLSKAQKLPLQDAELHNAQHRQDDKKPTAYADFIVDTLEFDLHAVGRKVQGEAEVLESVKQYQTEMQRFEEAEAKQKACGITCTIL